MEGPGLSPGPVFLLATSPMATRKNLRARHKRSKQSRAAKQLAKLKRDLEVAQIHASSANRLLQDLNKMLAGKRLVLLDYTTAEVLDTRGGTQHRLEARGAEWVGNGFSFVGKTLCMDHLLDDREVAMRGPIDREHMLQHVRKRLGGEIGAALLIDMQPRRRF